MTGHSDDLVIAILAAVQATALAEGVELTIAKRIARGAAAAIRSSHGGRECYVRSPGKSERNAEILDALERGERPAKIARKVGLHRSTVTRIRRSMADPEWEL